MERPTLFGGMPRYGKRRSTASHGGGKRRRGTGGRVRLSGRSMFINQLGGWSANKGPQKERSRTFELTTGMRASNAVVVTGRSYGVRELVFQPTYHLAAQTIFPTFQKWKLKKLELYVDMTGLSGVGNSETVQVTLAKQRDKLAPENIMNIPGAQTKILRVSPASVSPTDSSEGQLDVLRCACFWPPVSISGRNPSDNSSTTYLMNPWMDGEQYGQADFNAFSLQVTRSGNATSDTNYNFLYYFKATWIANTPVFNFQ